MLSGRRMHPYRHRLAKRHDVAAHIAVDAHVADLQLVLLLEQPLYLLNGHIRLLKPLLDLLVVEADPLPGRLFENRHLDHRGHHPGQLLLWRQRLLSAQAGYEDCNDADTLRSDPMLKTVCDQLPESDPDLATQPTFSRLENSVTKKDLMRLSRWLLRRYVRSLKKRRPAKIILDLDSTDDHTHGQQEFAFYHGYYRNHILHPLLIFDAATGDLVCAVLRPGNKGAASHIVPILKRVVEAIRQGVGTDVEIEIRADSGFATPRLYEFCEGEENQLQYVIGLSRNPRLQRVVEPLLDSTRERFVEREEKQRQFDEFLYRANSWDRSRRVIVKVEVDQRGINRRFVVTVVIK